MLQQIAQSFSSQGVWDPDSVSIGRAMGPGKPNPAADPSGIGAVFESLFNQASVKLELSRQGLQAAAKGEATPGEKGRDGGTGSGRAQSAGSSGPERLSQEEREELESLKKRDREVRAHERQHIAASGGNASGAPQYEYQSGPDGKNYAVGGHVAIEMSPVEGNPQATLQKALSVSRAALAPSDPSGQDRAVASQASQMARQALEDMRAQRARAESPSESGAGRRPNPYSKPALPVGSLLSAYA